MPRFFKRTLFITTLLAILVGSLVTGWTASRANLVIFKANWCASCRDVVPIAREIAAQNNLGVVEIDVDFQDAPKQARNYGLSIPNEEPPQIFYVDRGRTTRVYNGSSYRYGSGQAVRSTLLQNLQPLL